VAIALGVVAAGCSIGVSEPKLHDPGAPPARAEKKAGPLKVHLSSGELVVLRDWRVSPEGDRIRGKGDRYSATREPRSTEKAQDVALADVALLETTSEKGEFSAGLGVLGVVSFVVSAVTLYCTANPKSCFGSCPTFYVEGDGGAEPDRPQAEGFSESIARVLEARDLDALLVSRPGGSEVAIVMRNEALETHAVRRVRLVAAPKATGGHVLAGIDDRLYPAWALVPPASCVADEGDCRGGLSRLDGADRASPADGKDLAARETVELSFPAVAAGPGGVVVAARQTLLSTFLFYQTMAYTGRRAGEFLAAVERGGPESGRRALGMARALGGIDVEVAEGAGPWRAIGAFDEAGPIAGDRRVVPFEATGGGPVRVRLRLARGHWRLDEVALARLGPPVEPFPLEPATVEREGRPDETARERLVGASSHLVTGPGDAYRLTFRLPPADGAFELFLESEGYYYEWMRQEWLHEEDPAMALLAVADPHEALRRLAPAYKAQEGRLERQFWQSRFRR
jgi:hypothetical protein